MMCTCGRDDVREGVKVLPLRTKCYDIVHRSQRPAERKHQQCLHLYIQSISHHDLLEQGFPVSLRQENAEAMQDEAEEQLDAPQTVGHQKPG